MMNILLTAHKAMNAGVAVTAVNGQAISNKQYHKSKSRRCNNLLFFYALKQAERKSYER